MKWEFGDADDAIEEEFGCSQVK
jgi:hypothetical protein